MAWSGFGEEGWSRCGICRNSADPVSFAVVVLDGVRALTASSRARGWAGSLNLGDGDSCGILLILSEEDTGRRGVVCGDMAESSLVLAFEGVTA